MDGRLTSHVLKLDPIPNLYLTTHSSFFSDAIQPITRRAPHRIPMLSSLSLGTARSLLFEQDWPIDLILGHSIHETSIYPIIQVEHVTFR